MSLIPITLIMLIVLAAALSAATLRQPVHCALAAAGSFAAVGILFIGLGAEFLGFIQILVYAGGVGILIVFVLMLAPPVLSGKRHLKGSGAILSGATVLLIFITMATVILQSPSLAITATAKAPEASIAAIGEKLVASHLLPLQIAGVLLTAALIGAVLTVSEKE